MKIYDSVVIGSGAAGMTAALYLKRYNQEVLIIEKSAPGGVMNMTSRIDNYPGIKETNGVDLSLAMYNQLVELDVEFLFDEVINFSINDQIKIIKTNSEEIKTKSIIIATGRVPRKLGLEKEESLIGKGISFCAICDGFFYKNKEVIIVGGGNSALEETLYVSSIAKQVYIINRTDSFKADKILEDKVKQLSNVTIFNNNEVKEIVTDNGVFNGVILKDSKVIKADGMFLYIGYTPDDKLIKDLNINTDNGYIIVDKSMKTSIDGVYAVGDIIKKDIYQITTATGDGTIAATSVKDYLNK